MQEYSKAEDYARRAVKVDPSSTWGYFWVAASLGDMAMVSSVEKQLDLAGEIRDAIEESIARDPQNGLASHIYGVWHRKLAALGQGRRIVAGVFYGRSPPIGSLQKSIEYLKKAVALNPTVILSRLELARSDIAVQDFPMPVPCSSPFRHCRSNFPTTPSTRKNRRSFFKRSRIAEAI
jgi:tetratricopeptide (TPR) repeat protein